MWRALTGLGGGCSGWAVPEASSLFTKLLALPHPYPRGQGLLGPLPCSLPPLLSLGLGFTMASSLAS